MSAVSQFLRKADRILKSKKANSRFSDPFFSYYEDFAGTVIWTNDNLTDKQKQRILKRAGRDEG